MITGYACYRPGGHYPTPDPVADAFAALRLQMIAREANRFGSLGKQFTLEENVCYLRVSYYVDIEDDGAELHDFVMSLEDNSYGYLFWEVDTIEEETLLRSIDVACMNIKRRADAETSAEPL